MHLPRVAPRRRNPGLHGRIPLGFPEGGWGKARPSDSRRGNGDGPTLGVSGWGNWPMPISAIAVHVGIPGGEFPCAGTTKSEKENRSSPPHDALLIDVHPPFPAPNTKGVVPQSPGLRGSPRYPGCVWAICNNHNVVVPKERMCGLPRTGPVAILKTHDHVTHFAGSGHALTTSPHGAPAQPLRGC